MEENQLENDHLNYNFLKFYGQGSTYFGIVAINLVLIVLTLGLYYPWAKARVRKYIWNETEFLGSRFYFHGTGLEMFKGFVISYGLIITFYLLYFVVFSQAGSPMWVLYGWFFLLGFIVLFFLPFALLSSWRYRVSRTSWRGIHFGFKGRFVDFYKGYLVNLLLTVVTLGIGSAWLRVYIQQYFFRHTYFGDVQLNFFGEGSRLFGINILGGILSYITLGIYIPYFTKNRYNFTINNTTLSQHDGERKIRRSLYSKLTGGSAFEIMFVNLLLLIFTVGLAYPFTMMRFQKLLMENTGLPADINYDRILQTDENYRDATGDELVDIFDIDLGF